MSLIYGEYLVNVHFSDIPHTFIPHFTLHSAEKIRIEFSANYPLTTFRIPQSAFRKIPLPVTDSDIIFRINSMRTLTESHALECSRNLHIIQLLHTQTLARPLSVWSTFTEVNTVCSFAKKVGNLAVLVTSNQSQLLLQLPSNGLYLKHRIFT